MTGQVPALQLTGITKRYGAFEANSNIDFTLRKGEIHALLGENGAGKSTLMGIAYGLNQPDAGTIEVDGKGVNLTSPQQAIDAGIGMVHQHFMLIEVMTVAENIVLGNEPTRRGRLSKSRARRQVRELSDRFGFGIDPDAYVGDLSVGEQQRVEIMRALHQDAKVLILDEPTAVLTAGETEDLFRVLRDLRDNGTSIIFISHKLREVLQLTDRVTVLRRGKRTDTVATSDCDERRLAELMVGRDVLLRVGKQTQLTVGEPVLEVSDLTVQESRGLAAVDGLSLTVRSGEVVGIAGVDGNGQQQLVEALCGLATPTAGTVVLNGRDVTTKSVRQKAKAGIRYITEDRHSRGLVLGMSLEENLVLRDFRSSPFSRYGLLNKQAMERNADELLATYDVRSSGRSVPANTLSGGNQQKVVIAREVAADPSLLIAAQPTRGLDVGAIEFVHNKILDCQAAGKGVLLISFELDEIRALADRILVMYEGKIVGEFPPDTSDRELGIAMTGGLGSGASR